MRVLEDLKPERVFYFFEEISRIPRGSGSTKEVSDYCVRFAKERNLYVKQDEVNNIIIKKAATSGKENSPAVIMQGHLDMVTEKTNASKHDFMKDGLKLMVEGDFVTADGTTLGADNGIAVAYALAILDSDNISHPALEVIFTIDEETGMEGAQFVDMSDLKGKYLLNLDCDMEDAVIAGCAGGVRVNGKFQLNRKKVRGDVYKITVSGLKGGHSGSEIDKERGNANILLGRSLNELNTYGSMYIKDFAGGNKDNAITREAVANVVITDDKIDVIKVMENMSLIFKNEYSAADADVFIQVEKTESATENMVWSENAAQNVLDFIMITPNGPTNMCFGMNGLVETSLNLGITTTSDEHFNTVTTIRSVVASRKDNLKKKIIRLIEIAGGEASTQSDYPEWEYKRESDLQNVLKDIYKREFGRDLKVDVIHAGLECGYLLQKKPDLDAVSFGPVMYDIHTTEERLSISSTELTYKFLLKILKEL